MSSLPIVPSKHRSRLHRRSIDFVLLEPDPYCEQAGTLPSYAFAYQTFLPFACKHTLSLPPMHTPRAHFPARAATIAPLPRAATIAPLPRAATIAPRRAAPRIPYLGLERR